MKPFLGQLAEKLFDKYGYDFQDVTLVFPNRRAGLFFAIEMEAVEVVQQVVDNCLKEGVIGFWFLSTPTAFRLSPPLCISDEELTTAAAIILKVMDEV